MSIVKVDYGEIDGGGIDWSPYFNQTIAEPLINNVRRILFPCKGMNHININNNGSSLDYSIYGRKDNADTLLFNGTGAVTNLDISGYDYVVSQRPGSSTISITVILLD